MIGDSALSLGAKMLDVHYPLADILLLLGPAPFIVLVALRLGKGSLAWPQAHRSI